MNRLPILLTLALVLGLTACAHVGQEPASPSVPRSGEATATQEAFQGVRQSPLREGTVAPEVYRLFKGEYAVSDSLQRRAPASIAVLPFSGDPRNWNFVPAGTSPTEVVRRGLYNHLASLPFRDVELREVDDRLAGAGLSSPLKFLPLLQSNPKRLRDILNVDAVVVGEVTHFDRVYLGLVSQVAVGCSVELRDLETGELLWRAQHVSRELGGGVSLDIVGAVFGALSSIWSMREVELQREADNLFREIVLTLEQSLPLNFGGGERPKSVPPRIDLFVCINGDKVLGEGDAVGFRLVGDPGNRATAELVGFRGGIELHPLPETAKQSLWGQVRREIIEEYRRSGRTATPEILGGVDRELRTREIYEGEYKILPGEKATSLVAKGYLESRSGLRAEAWATGRQVVIDGKSSDPPQGLVAEALDRSLRLRWTPLPGVDVTGYEVLRSDNALSGFETVLSTERPECVIERLLNFEPAYYKVRALNRAGNPGQESEPLRARALPEPGLDDMPRPESRLAGSLEGQALLVREKSPFTVTGVYVVPSGAALHIEPGVEMHFASGAALQVRGGELLVWGRHDRPVRFSPASGGAGSYEGLVLDGARRARLEHAHIEHAATGLRVRACAAEILNGRISGATQSGLAFEEGARPVMRCSRVADNQGMGGLVIEGEGVRPDVHGNDFENNAPFHIQSFPAVEYDFSGNWWGDGGPRADSVLGTLRLEPALAGPAARSGACLRSD